MEKALERLNWCWLEWTAAIAVGNTKDIEKFGLAKCQIKAVMEDLGYELEYDREKGYRLKEAL